MASQLKEKLKWLDPFTYVDLYIMPRVNPKHDETIELLVNAVSAFVFAFILYNYILAFLLGTQTPLVIVYSGSMEPTLYRGDIVVLASASSLDVKEAKVGFPIGGKTLRDYAQIGVEKMPSGRVREASIRIGGKQYAFDPEGPIVVYTSQLRQEDIIHRAVLKLTAPDGTYLLTFGDNNDRIDEDCQATGAGTYGCINLSPVPAQALHGKYLFHIPLLGYAKLLLFDDLPRILSGSPLQQL